MLRLPLILLNVLPAGIPGDAGRDVQHAVGGWPIFPLRSGEHPDREMKISGTNRFGACAKESRKQKVDSCGSDALVKLAAADRRLTN